MIFFTLYILEHHGNNRQHFSKTVLKTGLIVYCCFEVVLLLVFYNCYNRNSDQGHSREFHMVIDEIYGMIHAHENEDDKKHKMGLEAAVSRGEGFVMWLTPDLIFGCFLFVVYFGVLKEDNRILTAGLRAHFYYSMVGFLRIFYIRRMLK